MAYTFTPTYTLVSFTTVGTATWTLPSGVTSFDYFILGGGGGGGSDGAVGGSGGQAKWGTVSSPSGTYTISVGSGGAGAGSGYSAGGTGGNTTLTGTGVSATARGGYSASATVSYSYMDNNDSVLYSSGSGIYGAGTGGYAGPNTSGKGIRWFGPGGYNHFGGEGSPGRPAAGVSGGSGAANTGRGGQSGGEAIGATKTTPAEPGGSGGSGGSGVAFIVYRASGAPGNFDYLGTVTASGKIALGGDIWSHFYQTVGEVRGQVNISSYYRSQLSGGGTKVPNTWINRNVPQSGVVKWSNYYGTSNSIKEYFQLTADTNTQSLYLTEGTWIALVRMTGGGGGGGGWDGGEQGSYGGAGFYLTSRFNNLTVAAGKTGRLISYGSRGGGAGYQGGNYPGGQGGGGYLAGGAGGNSGPGGSSGSGGGGGGASALVWQPDTSVATFILIAFAGGGGGGVGAGNRSITQVANTVSLANYGYKGLAFTEAPVLAITADSTGLWDPATGGNPYRISTTSIDGQGWTTMRNYYPPGLTDAYVGYDGGAGGGGGAGDGRSGGLARSANQNYRWYAITDKGGNFQYWQPPNEFSGYAGGQGYGYINFTYNTNYVYNYDYQNVSTVLSGYGGGGGATLGTSGWGQPGAVLLKVTNNLDDYNYF